MKKSIFFVVLMLVISIVTGCTCQSSTRDYAYEAYCDSIWENDPDYYSDVLCETDEYLEYVKTHGAWWDQ